MKNQHRRISMKIPFKNLIKNLISTNTYLTDYVYNFRDKILDNEWIKILESQQNKDYMESDNLDFLREIQHKVASDVIRNYSGNINWDNAHIYGIWKDLFGLYSKCIYDSPAIEHGLILYNSILSDVRYTARMGCATFGEFRKSIIQKQYNIPVFCVGPYIHYADEFYGAQQANEYRNRFGKTLLVFPMHSIKETEISVNQENFLKKIKSIACDYNTVLVNTYWWNINDKLIKRLKSEGYRIISCGLREDEDFLSRLKSYLLMSDLVIGDGIGTHIGYAVQVGTPFSYVECDSKITSFECKQIEKNRSFMEENCSIIKKAFIGSESIGERERKICDYFWGSRCIKSEDQLKKIVEITEELLSMSKGNCKRTYSASKKLLAEYEKSDIEKYNLLLNSLPSTLPVMT